MKLLLICDRADISEKLTSVLAAWAETQPEKTAHVYTASSSVEGRTMAQEHDCDVILLYSPLEGALGDEPAVQLSRLTGASVVVITPEKVACSPRVRPPRMTPAVSVLKNSCLRSGVVARRTPFPASFSRICSATFSGVMTTTEAPVRRESCPAGSSPRAPSRGE